MKTTAVTAALIFLFTTGIAGCGKETDKAPREEPAKQATAPREEPSKQAAAPKEELAKQAESPVTKPVKPVAVSKEELAKYEKARATITTGMGKIVLRFFPDLAPIHVKNFITLAEKGFYTGTSFHRVIPGFMIQGGDPKGNGTGGPGYTIPAEFSSRKHVAGIISMARTSDPDSAGSQFFIVVAPAPSLDEKYSVFGKVVEGLDVVKKIVAVPRNRRDKPLEPVTMEVTVSYEK
jgi:peptidyl-prolyl cis-trans isomerase B (cyclophilin B)